MKLQAIIFDLDGTLGNTLPVCYEAFRVALKEFQGRHYTDAEIRATFGPSEEGVIQRLVPERWEACLATFLAAYESAHAGYAAPFPGIEAALQLLQARGVALAIVTGKGVHSAAISLRYLGLAPYFAAIETGSPNGVIKAEAIRRLLAGWGIPAERAAYVGDAAFDMVAAREAGVAPLAAAWAPGTDVPALQAQAPLALFRTVEGFRTWVADHIKGDGGHAG